MATWTRCAWIGWAAVAAAVGCGAPETPGSAPPVVAEAPLQVVPATGVIARVGEGFVTADDFAAAVSAMPGADASMPLEQRAEILEQLMNEERMFQEALKQGLVRDPKVRKVLVNLLIRTEVYPKAKNAFTDEELRAYYDAHKDDFAMPEKVQLRRILITYGESRTRDEALQMIDKARKQIIARPTTFRDVAEQLSEDAYRRKGGDLGFVSREGIPGVDPKVAEVAFTLKVGDVSEPFEADGGLNIVMVAARREPMTRTFEQLRGSVQRKLRSEATQERTAAFVERLATEMPGTIDQEALMAVPIQARFGGVLRQDDAGEADEAGDE